MCVPAHDERDFAFAKKFNLPIIQVISDGNENIKELEVAFTKGGTIINSAEFNGLNSDKSKDQFLTYMEKNSLGKRKTNYKLRDWVFSRQRYWGEPIPIIHCNSCGVVGVPEEDLPVILPNIEAYLPTDTGESPLSHIEDFVNTTCPKCKAPAKRETNTMQQWAGSSWYYLRYTDTKNSTELASSESINKWTPVDYYVGGIEHAVLHLLYARFYTKFLFDIGVVPFEEPFKKLFNQGMINKDGSKMSKSKGNVVSPDALVEKYGCDALRMYELFVGPPELDCEWDDSGIDGVYRYLNKVWKLVIENKDKIIDDNIEFEILRHKMTYEITNRLNNLTLNTTISGFMEFTNILINLSKQHNGICKQTLDTLIILLAPFAPHISEEMWQIVGHSESVFKENWPTFDIEKTKSNTIEIAIQVNGKLRGSCQIDVKAEKEAVINIAKEVVADKLSGLEVIKEIYVPNKIVNFVAK